MNYPDGIKIKKTHIKYANRGMNLESDINETNTYYRDNNIALIYKKPTPIKVIKMEYPYTIKEAIFVQPSTLDYNGVYKGLYLDFDVKETKNKTSFPISNIHKHQLNHIKNVIIHKGIAFIIVSFTSLNKIFLLFGEDIIDFINNNNRKSLPIEYFNKHGYLIELKYSPRLDYLKIIDKYMEEKWKNI